MNKLTVKEKEEIRQDFDQIKNQINRCGHYQANKKTWGNLLQKTITYCQILKTIARQ